MIYVDMDGVVADFAGGVTEWLTHKAPNLKPEQKQIDITRWDLGLSDEVWAMFWLYEERVGSAFWTRLKLLEGGNRLIKFLDDRVGRIGWRFLTSPSNSTKAHEGKVLFAKKHFDLDPRNVILCNEKHLLSKYGTLLIDDCNYNVDTFYHKGCGMSVLWPQPWNRATGQHYKDAMMGIDVTLNTPELMNREDC